MVGPFVRTWLMDTGEVRSPGSRQIVAFVQDRQIFGLKVPPIASMYWAAKGMLTLS